MFTTPSSSVPLFDDVAESSTRILEHLEDSEFNLKGDEGDGDGASFDQITASWLDPIYL